GKEQMILRTRRALSSAANPTSPLPALLFTIVRSFAPWSIRASINSLGMPATPKPPIMIVAPSKMSATAAEGEPTVLSIIVPPGGAPEPLPEAAAVHAFDERAGPTMFYFRTHIRITNEKCEEQGKQTAIKGIPKRRTWKGTDRT